MIWSFHSTLAQVLRPEAHLTQSFASALEALNKKAPVFDMDSVERGEQACTEGLPSHLHSIRTTLLTEMELSIAMMVLRSVNCHSEGEVSFRCEGDIQRRNAAEKHATHRLSTRRHVTACRHKQIGGHLL